VIPVTASNAESGIEISGQRYVSARHVASMLGAFLRTLSRWNAAGADPTKVGKKVFYDLGKLPEWLASREIPPTRITGQS